MKDARNLIATMLMPLFLLFLAMLEIASAGDPCPSLTVTYCTTCHDTVRICKAVQEKDEQEWKGIMKVMGEYGELDQETLDQMLACVKKMKDGSSEVCATKELKCSLIHLRCRSG